MAPPAPAAPEPSPRRPGRIVEVPEFRRWLAAQDRDTRLLVRAQGERMHRDPRAHCRPLVDTLKGSRMPNLKELRVTGTVRVLFARDPARNTVMLFGGDKAGQAKRFYRAAMPTAERRYAQHLKDIGKEPPWPHHNPPNRRPPSRGR